MRKSLLSCSVRWTSVENVEMGFRDRHLTCVEVVDAECDLTAKLGDIAAELVVTILLQAPKYQTVRGEFRKSGRHGRARVVQEPFL